jgi:hypothetical protein
MEKKEVVKIFSIFSVCYPKFIESGKEELMLEVWHSLLKNYPYELVKHAAETHIKSSRFAPTIHDLIQHITEYENIGKLDGMSAWGKVLKAIRNYGYYREAEALQSMPPEVAEVVKAMGWQTLCLSENEIADRAHFIKAYDTMQKREQQVALMRGNDYLKLGR